MRTFVFLILWSISISAFAQVEPPTDSDPNLRLAFKAATLNESQIQLTPSQIKSANRTIRHLKNGENELAIKSWRRLVADKYFGDQAININLLIQMIIRQSYIDTIDELRMTADTVRYHNSQKKTLREAISRARTHRSDLKRQFLPTGEIDLQIGKLLECDDQNDNSADLATVDLQNSLQQMQSSLQMLSNLLKSFHDPALSVIRNIKS